MPEISIGAYNTHLYEGTVVGVQPKQLFRDAARQVAFQEQLCAAGMDVIGLSEVWASKTQDSIMAALRGVGMDGYAYQKGPVLKLNPGTVLCAAGALTKPPMSFLPYNQLTGWDKFAEKGVTYGRVRLHSAEIFVVQTHTQASYVGSEKEDRTVREAGIRSVLFPVIDQALQDFTGPVFLLGDLNISADSDEYKAFSLQMKGRGLRDAWAALDTGQPGYTYDPDANNLVKHFDPSETVSQRLDYIYFREGTARVKDMKVLKWKTVDGVDLSDHYGICATFDI
jgi:endonuclease/exonuclease/phosphatase family metal-dependent hydrolase